MEQEPTLTPGSATNGVGDHSNGAELPGAMPGQVNARFSHIKGWGSDLDHANRPAYPKERTPPRLEGVHWDTPEAQPLKTEVYHSIERPGMTPVFGTSVPSRGLSGMLRGIAFRYSENDLRHWFLLLLADRINVVEGIVDDLRHGHVPNIYREIGAPAELRHNPRGFARKAVIASVALGATLYLLRRKKGRIR